MSELFVDAARTREVGLFDSVGESTVAPEKEHGCDDGYERCRAEACRGSSECLFA